MWSSLIWHSLCGNLGRPTSMKWDESFDPFIRSRGLKEHLSDAWIAPFIHLQLFLLNIEATYSSIQASNGIALIRVMRDSLQRQFDTVRASVENEISHCSSPTGLFYYLTSLIVADDPYRECSSDRDQICRATP